MARGTHKGWIFVMNIKKSALAILLLLLLLASGCATLRGVAEDFENLGRGLKRTVSDDDDRRR